MNVEYHRFYSHCLGKDMEFKSYGSHGKPVVVFPSSGGRFYEYEDFQMVDACLPFLEQGLVRLYTVDSIDHETWLNHTASPAEIGRRHNDYDAYIVKELVPFIHEHSGYSGKFMATGCSMGGYHSANFFFRHPDVFDTLIALSGLYDVRFFLGDALTEFDVYINSPIDYLSNMNDPWYLEQYRQSNIIVCTGLGAWEEDAIRDTRHLEWVLTEKQVPAWIDYWGEDVNHDWPWWRIQLAYFLDQLQEQQRL